MATAARSLRAQWMRREAYTIPRRFQSSFAYLETELPKRNIVPIFNDLSPLPSYRLDHTLADYLPEWGWTPPSVLPLAQTTAAIRHLPIPHHMVYFEPTKRANEILADGTNLDHAPGPDTPFQRRMWAGGRVLYNNDNPLALDGSRALCAEFIRSATLRGPPTAEKLFVRIERRIALASPSELTQIAHLSHSSDSPAHLYHHIRQRLWRNSEEDFGPASILESRTLVFLLPATTPSPTPKKLLKPQHIPTYTHPLTPRPPLLFHFSALTHNAHAIHLDPAYTLATEHQPALLVQGPLAYTILVTLLQQHLQRDSNEVIKSVEYKNLAPLYCGEAVKFCGARTGERRWEVWAEGPEGGMAVMGTVRTEGGRIDKANLGV